MRRVSRTALSLSFVLGAVVPTTAQAIRYGDAAIVSLGPDASAQTLGTACRGLRSPTCVRWTVRGFSIDARPELRFANAFAAARGGRIVAAAGFDIAWSEDRGQSWHAAGLDAHQAPLALAFDANGSDGVAVGAFGTIWTTSDAGSSWRVRRDGGVEDLVDVATTAGATVVVGARGSAWATFDGGTRLDELAGTPLTETPVLAIRAGAVWMYTPSQTWRVADGSVALSPR